MMVVVCVGGGGCSCEVVVAQYIGGSQKNKLATMKSRPSLWKVPCCIMALALSMHTCSICTRGGLIATCTGQWFDFQSHSHLMHMVVES